MRTVRRRLADLFGVQPHGPVWVRALGGGRCKAGCRLCGCGDVFAQLACAAVCGWALGKLAVELGLVVATGAAAAMLGARLERWRHRDAHADAIDMVLGARHRHREMSLYERARWDTERTELVDLTIALRAENEELREAIPKVWQRGYEAGQHKAEFGLATDEVEKQQRQRARWN